MATLPLRRSPLLALHVSICAVGLAVAVACGGSSDNGRTATDSGTGALVSATVTATPEPVSAEDAVKVYAVVDALRTKDLTEIRPHVGFRKIACAANSNDPSVPTCQSGEEDGDQIDAFYYGTCQGEYLRPVDVDEPLNVLTDMDVYGAYRIPKKGDSPYQYSIVLVDNASERDGAAWEAVIDDGEVIGLLFSCSLSPEDLVAVRRYTDAVPTPGAAALTPTP